MTLQRRCSSRPLSRTLQIALPAIVPPPCAAAHARDALRAIVAASAGDASCCSTSRRQRCCQWCSHRPRNEDGGARPCIGGFSANELRRIPADKYPWLHPTWEDRSKSSAPPVRASFFGADSSVLSWHGYSIRLHEKRMRGVLMDAPRQEALARARPEISWFLMPDSET